MITGDSIPLTMIVFFPVMFLVIIGEMWARGFLTDLPRILRITLYALSAEAAIIIVAILIITGYVLVRGATPWS